MKIIFIALFGLFFPSLSLACASCIDYFECRFASDDSKTLFVGGNWAFDDVEEDEIGTKVARLNFSISDSRTNIVEWFSFENPSNDVVSKIESSDSVRLGGVNPQGEVATVIRMGTFGQFIKISEVIEFHSLVGCSDIEPFDER